MKIWNCSRRFVKTHIEDIRANDALRVISVNDIGAEAFDFGSTPEKSLILYFADATPNDTPNNAKLFTEDMARAILAFALKAQQDSKKILVHCSAGISRSSAISKNLNDFLNKALEENPDDWQENLKFGFEYQPFPNSHVSATMNRVISNYLDSHSDTKQ